MSGFFLFFKIKPEIDTWYFAKVRFLRLAPNLWLSIILLGILSILIKGIVWSFDGNILRILLLHNLGFAPPAGGTHSIITWFISALFWVSIFYFYISKIFEKKYLNLIIGLLVMFCYAAYMQNNKFTTGGHVANISLIFNMGVCRALASMGLGYFISMAYREGILQKLGVRGTIFINICEVFLIGFLSYYMFFSAKLPGKTGMCYIVLFAILFYLMLIKKGIISNLLDNDICAKLGKYSYSIYCFHGVIISIFRHHVFKHNPSLLVNHRLLSYSIQTLCAVAFGVVSYHIFEKPVANFINKELSK